MLQEHRVLLYTHWSSNYDSLYSAINYDVWNPKNLYQHALLNFFHFSWHLKHLCSRFSIFSKIKTQGVGRTLESYEIIRASDRSRKKSQILEDFQRQIHAKTGRFCRNFQGKLRRKTIGKKWSISSKCGQISLEIEFDKRF